MSGLLFHINEDNGAYLYTIDNFINKEYADFLFTEGDNLSLIHNPKNRMGEAHRDMGFFSKSVPYYQFSGQKARTIGCPEYIEKLIRTINECLKEGLDKVGFKLNACLVNKYVSGEDYCGLHADEEKQLKQQLVVAISVFKDPLGSRKFRIRRKNGQINGKNFMDIPTKHGQLLVMGGTFQQHFKHEIPIEKSNKNCYRISYTIRSHSEDEKDY